VLVVVLDIFHTLWHPSTSGMLSHWVGRGLWRLAHVGSRGPGSTIGPWVLVAVLLTWGSLVVLGYTLIYWAHMEESFYFSSGLSPGERSDFVDSLYLSLVTFSTLGYGDITPETAWLRLAAPLEAMTGFMLLSASITWVLQLYPALSRRRTLALELSSLQQQDLAGALPELDSSAGADLLNGLSSQVSQVRVDHTQYAHMYYFWDGPATSLPLHLSYAEQLAAAGARSGRPDVRLMAGALSSALDDFATLVRDSFVSADGDTAQVLRAYRADHHVDQA